MFIKLELDQVIGAGEKTSCMIPIESEEDILIDCIQSVVGEDCCISFCNYYSNANLMNFERMFPYIVRDGVVSWFVPFTEVSIRDFRNTHYLGPEEVIHAEIDAFGGAGDDLSEIISWVANNWDTIYTGASLLSSSITIGSFVQKVYKFFSNRKHRVPLFIDVKDSIWKQEKWDREELMKRLKIPDSELLDCVLQSAGYERIENTFRKKTDCDDFKKTKYNVDHIWGKSVCNELGSELSWRIQELNIMLTDLKFRSENLDLNIFPKVEGNINALLTKWDTYLRPGENFCFIMLTDLPYRNTLSEIEDDVERLDSYARKMIDIITGIEEQEDMTSQDEVEWPVYDTCEGEQEESSEDEYLVDQDSEEYEEDEKYDEDETDDRYVSPWEPLLIKLFLNGSLVKVKTETETWIAYLEQVYDNDVLLQVLSEKGKFIEYRTINIYDIQMITMDTEHLKTIAKKAPKEQLPSLATYDVSAKNFLVDFAAENDVVLTIAAHELQGAPLTVKVETDLETDYSDECLIKLRLLSDRNKENGVAWIEQDSIDWIRLA